MKFLVQFSLSLGKECLIIDSIVFKNHTIKYYCCSRYVILYPFEGEAFLHSQMNEIPGFLRAFSNSKLPFGVAAASFLNSSREIYSFASSQRFFACAASLSKIFMRSPRGGC